MLPSLLPDAPPQRFDLPIYNPAGSRPARPPARTDWRNRWVIALWLFAFATVPAVAVQFFSLPPTHRHVHMESFRYGQEPSVVRCNRGDTLHLTFATRDTAHSFFLQEFDVDAKITPGSDEVLVFRPSRPDEPPHMASEVVLHARHPGWLGWLVSKSQYRCHVWCGPMHAFEHGNLVLWPNTLLAAGWGLLLGIPLLAWSRSLRAPVEAAASYGAEQTDGVDLFRRFPWLKWLLKRRELQGVLLVASASGCNSRFARKGGLC